MALLQLGKVECLPKSVISHVHSSLSYHSTAGATVAQLLHNFLFLMFSYRDRYRDRYAKKIETQIQG